MIQFLFILFYALNLQANEEQAWRLALQNKKEKLTLTSYKTLTRVETQISCEHLAFRYEKLNNLLDDLSWVIGLNAKTDSAEAAFTYIENRLQADPRPLAHDFHYEVETFIPNEKLLFNEKTPNSLAILGAPHFELHLPESSELSFSKLEKTELGLKVSLKINAYDICARKRIDFLLLDDCPVNEEQPLLCTEGVICPSPITTDWQQCKSARAFQLRLDSFGEKLGFRAKEIRRKTP